MLFINVQGQNLAFLLQLRPGLHEITVLVCSIAKICRAQQMTFTHEIMKMFKIPGLSRFKPTALMV